MRPQACVILVSAVQFMTTAAGSPPQNQPPSTGARDLIVVAGKSVIVDSPVDVQRVSVANGDFAEAVAIGPREVLVNGKSPGDTSMIIWQQGGQRLFFDLSVRRNESRFDAVRRQLSRELGSDEVTFDVEGDSVFLRGTVKDLTSAERAVAIASTMGKPVNLLRVNVPLAEPQILLKVRFANVDRAATTELGLNFISTGATNTIGSVTTGQFTPPTAPSVGSSNSGAQTRFTLSDALNLFFFRPDLNLGATIRALQSRRLLEILAEPNVLAINGRPANFLAGGEFPFPTLQGGGSGLGAVTIQFREFGVRINFTPYITPRGTIRLTVIPEVSSLDFANGLVFQGFNIPALSTRRVQTEVELQSGQSFAIGGLLDNRVIQNLSRIPGLGDIPFFGKLFRSQQLIKNNTELLIMVTPELVRPMPQGMPLPDINYPEQFMKPNTPNIAMRTPGISATGPAPATPPLPPIPLEQLIQSQRALQQPGAGGQTPTAPQIQFVPMLMPPAPQAPGPAATPPPAAPAPAAPPAANSGAN